MNGESLTIKEMASVLHIKPGTMHSKRWQQKTGCPLIKKGKRRLALASEFWEWFKQNN